MAPPTGNRVTPEDDAGLATRRWMVGRAVLISVVEDEIDHIPPEFFFADARAEAVGHHRWLPA